MISPSYRDEKIADAANLTRRSRSRREQRKNSLLCFEIQRPCSFSSSPNSHTRHTTSVCDTVDRRRSIRTRKSPNCAVVCRVGMLDKFEQKSAHNLKLVSNISQQAKP